ncbi:MAG: hypothetical protein ACREMH_00610 [Gemmatimonadales bacterium]
MPRHSLVLTGGVLLAVLACADVSDPLPPPLELVLVPDSAVPDLSVLPAADPGALTPVSLLPGSTPAAVATRGRLAAIPLGAADAVEILDLDGFAVLRVVSFPDGSEPAEAAFTADTVLFVTLAGHDRVARIDLVTGDTSSIEVGSEPRAIVFTRGRLFVLSANTEPCESVIDRCALGPSWIDVLDPDVFEAPGPADSIGLPGSLNARAATVGDDGQLYVIAQGDAVAPDGRLAIVDPVREEEVATFGGLGVRPARPAPLGDRLLIASPTEGLMEFNTRTRQFTRGAGNGIPLGGAVGVATDGEGRVWVARQGACPGGPGTLTQLRSDLTSVRDLPLGACPTAAAVALVPRED